MRFHAAAFDYDGTLARHGVVAESTLGSLQRLRDSRRRLIMVTGRLLEDLEKVFPCLDLFDVVVAENGAQMNFPSKKESILLGEPPPPQFIEALRASNISPLSIGQVIVATWEPNETAVLNAIRETGLEHQVIFNKGAVMVLPTGINKASGLSAALKALGLSPHNVVGIGDAENDHAFLTLCERSVAVANALESIKEKVDIVTRGDHGTGVEELIDEILRDDLASRESRAEHHVLVGHDRNDNQLTLPPYGSHVLVAGPSGSGKSTVVTAILEQLVALKYQFLVVDPEGDYVDVASTVTLGDTQRSTTPDEVVQLLRQDENPIVNLLGTTLADRPQYLLELLQRTRECEREFGKPHWVVLDEAHHMYPLSLPEEVDIVPQKFASSILITVHPSHLHPAALEACNVIIAVGKSQKETFREFSEAAKAVVPSEFSAAPAVDEVSIWFRNSPSPIVPIRIEASKAERRRHVRKYAEGDLKDNSFYFRGREGKLNLRAQNLELFVQLAEGVDDDTWLYHLKNHDYSDWVRRAIKDEALLNAVKEAEDAKLSAAESRERIKSAIQSKYTAAE
jgi:hydroxymethylpyrimidine pyrophosphatase-like HAD family hydrolase